MRPRQLVLLSVVGLLALPGTTFAKDLTLSDAGLMLLDWHDLSRNGRVVARRDVSGPGVEFDIDFPGNEWPDNSLMFASTRFDGESHLAGLDLSDYDNFALTFTMLAVDGDTTPGIGGSLVIGAVVYDSANGYRYKPEVIDMGQYHGSSDTSITSVVPSARQDGLGINVHMLTSNNWSPSGNTVTVLIQPTTGAIAIPEPLTATLISASFLFWRRTRRRRLRHVG